MVFGKTLEMRSIDSEQLHKEAEYVGDTKWVPVKIGEGKRALFFKPPGLKPHFGPSRDRALPGKARRKARKIQNKMR